MSMLKAGAVKMDITPDYPVWLDGNPRDRKSEGVHDPIFARALALESPEGPFVLLSLDLCALPGEVTDAARRLIAECAGIPFERQVIACNHIHSAPAMYGFFCPREEKYVEWLLGRLLEVTRQAHDAALPARVGSGSGEEFTISEYRRFGLKDGRIAMNWDTFTPEELIGPAGVMDPEVGVVRIDALSGKTVAVLYNHAGHPNTPPGTSFRISADYPGVASACIERELGGVSLFTNGAQGSVDIPAFRERDWEGMARKGTWLAREVLRVAGGITPSNGTLSVANSRFNVGARKISPDYVARCREIAARPAGLRTIRDGVDEALYANMCLDLVAMGCASFDVEITGFRIGDASFVSFPGELFTEIGRRIKTERPGRRTFIVDVANGYLGYVPTRRAIQEGGYETRPGVSSRLEEGAEDIIVEHAVKLLNSL
jgi:neutral ceramidase